MLAYIIFILDCSDVWSFCYCVQRIFSSQRDWGIPEFTRAWEFYLFHWRLQCENWSFWPACCVPFSGNYFCICKAEPSGYSFICKACLRILFVLCSSLLFYQRDVTCIIFAWNLVLSIVPLQQIWFSDGPRLQESIKENQTSYSDLKSERWDVSIILLLWVEKFFPWLPLTCDFFFWKVTKDAENHENCKQMQKGIKRKSWCE